MNRSELLRLARTGAEARLQALRAEIQSIFRLFPDLRRAGSGRATRAGAGNGRVRRRRQRRMSPAARKAVSVRMKKYWAARRKAKAAK